MGKREGNAQRIQYWDTIKSKERKMEWNVYDGIIGK